MKYLFFILLLIGLVAVLGNVPSINFGGSNYAKGVLPSAMLTPGTINTAVTQANIKTTICVVGWTATIRPTSSYTTALKKKQIKEYGYSDTATADYEEDHYLSLEISGAPSSPSNLWPEPLHVNSGGYDLGAHTKDSLENKLHTLICEGSITLNEAHQAIRDWPAAYQKYIGPWPRYGSFGGTASGVDLDDETSP